jgi:REP element-mobilizing transposase RayT
MRGYVRKGHSLPGDPKLLKQSRQLLKSAPVFFSASERDALFATLVSACEEFQYRLSDVTVESWHLHWILFHGDEPIARVVGRLKTRMRQALARGRIWTEGYCAEPLFDAGAVEQAQEYIAKHRLPNARRARDRKRAHQQCHTKRQSGPGSARGSAAMSCHNARCPQYVSSSANPRQSRGLTTLR